MTRRFRFLIARVLAVTATATLALGLGSGASSPHTVQTEPTTTTTMAPPPGYSAGAAAPTDAPAGPAMTAPASRSVPGDGESKLMLVMDSSGSMAEPAGGGLSKIEAAKESLDTVIDTLPSDQPTGMRVYGAQIGSTSDPDACTDSQLVVPVGSDNRDELRDAVDGYKPVGQTPIGYALQQAAYDLGKSGRRNIILVSDGEATCPQPDPCLVSRDLRAEGIDLRIDVIGLNVNSSARKQLQCVAQSGGGVYYDAHDPQELTDSLTKLAERAARPYETIGQTVTGAKSWKDAPPIAAGDWQDELPPPKGIYDGQRFYRVEREYANSTLFVSAAYQAPDGSSNIELSLVAPDGTECSSGYDSQLFTDGMLLAVGARAGQLGDEAQPVQADDPCLTSKHLTAVVSYSDTEQTVPIELRVTELPEITNIDDLEDVTETPDWESPEAGATEVTGGTSFGDAEALEPGGYAGTIVPGETLTYSVDVDWGEQLDVAAHIDELTGALGTAVAGDPSIYMQVFGPSRLPAGTTEASTDLNADATLGAGGSDDLGLTTGPVTYDNVGYNAGAAQAGTYTVTLYLEDNDENASLPVPYQLGVDLVGDATDPPAHDEQPFGTTDTTADGDTTDGTNTGAAPPPASGDSGGTRWDWIIGLALLAAVTLALLRLRRQHTPAADTHTRAALPPPATTRPRPAGPDMRRRSTQIAHRVFTSARDIIRSNPTIDTLPARENEPSPPPSRDPHPSPAGPSAPQHPATHAGPPEPQTVQVSAVLDAASGHGIGLTGPGAAAAARGALVNLLRGYAGDVEVLIPTGDLTHLLDGQPPEQAMPAQLTTAASLETALDWLETELVARTRHADEHEENHQDDRGPDDAGAGRPWIVLLTRPAPGAQQRLAAVLEGGARLGITGIILGPWQPAHTLAITADGIVAPSTPGAPTSSLSRTRLTAWPAYFTRERLDELAKAYPFQRPAVAEDESETNPAVSLYRLEILNPPTGEPDPDPPATGGVGQTPGRDTVKNTAVPAASTFAPPLKLSIFGTPRLVWRDNGREVNLTTKPGRRQRELLCYLALHPNGASRATIADTLWPDSPVDRPTNALQKTAQRLRATLAEATGDAVTESLLIHEGIYRLDPDIVAVDYWDFAHAVTTARTTTDLHDQQNAVQQVLALHTGPLADGLDLEWIDTHRRTAQHDVINAVSRLAQRIVDDQPERTLDLLEAARPTAPDNELIYRDIMRLQHKLGRDATISSTLKLLTTCMAEVDAKPGPDTVQLAHRLQRQPSPPSGQQ